MIWRKVKEDSAVQLPLVRTHQRDVPQKFILKDSIINVPERNVLTSAAEYLDGISMKREGGGGDREVPY